MFVLRVSIHLDALFCIKLKNNLFDYQALIFFFNIFYKYLKKFNTFDKQTNKNLWN